MAGKRKRNPTMTELLRKALRECESLNAVQRATGVKRQTLAKFMRGEQTIRLDSADVLAEYFGLVLGATVSIGRNEVTKVRYRIPSTLEVRTIPDLKQVVRMMMVLDAIKSAHRWFKLIGNDDRRPVAQTDQLISVIIAAGWSGEALKSILIPAAKENLIARAVLNTREAKAAWDRCMTRNLSRAHKKLLYVRRCYFAHFDEKIAGRFLRRLSKGEVEPVVLETESESRESTRYVWSYLAIATDLYDFRDEKPQLANRDIGSAIWDVILLLEEAISVVLRNHNVEFIPTEGGDE